MAAVHLCTTMVRMCSPARSSATPAASSTAHGQQLRIIEVTRDFMIGKDVCGQAQAAFQRATPQTLTNSPLALVMFDPGSHVSHGPGRVLRLRDDSLGQCFRGPSQNWFGARAPLIRSHSLSLRPLPSAYSACRASKTARTTAAPIMRPFARSHCAGSALC